MRFFWWDNNNISKPPKAYQLTVHGFNLTNSPSVTGFAVRRTADKNRAGLTADAIEAKKHNIYVDNLSKSVPDSQSVVVFAHNFTAVHALVDSGASHSHIDLKAAEWLKLLAPTGTTSKVALAKQTATLKTLGKTIVELEAFDNKYLMKLDVCKNLCADLILGQDFMKMHQRVVFELNKKGKDVVISLPVCGVKRQIFHLCVYSKT